MSDMKCAMRVVIWRHLVVHGLVLHLALALAPLVKGAPQIL